MKKLNKKILIGTFCIVLLVCLFFIFCKKELQNKVNFFDKSYCRSVENGYECIWFGTDSMFSYSEQTSGNPVDDYDLCESYEYNENDSTIILHCDYGKNDETIKLISVEKNSITLEFNDKRTFERE